MAALGKHMAFRFSLGAIALLALATPAMAQGVQIPEPSGMTLFALSALGVMVGRRLAARRPGRDD